MTRLAQPITWMLRKGELQALRTGESSTPEDDDGDGRQHDGHRELEIPVAEVAPHGCGKPPKTSPRTSLQK